MKTIIYAGITLFSVATVYGVADYYSSKQKGTLDKLYVEEEKPVVYPKAEEKVTLAIPAKEITTIKLDDKAVELTSDKKSKKKKKEIKFENFSRARIPEEVLVEKVTEVPAKKQEEIKPEKAEAAPVQTVATERKLSLDMYSRAPLKKLKIPVKKEPVKN